MENEFDVGDVVVLRSGGPLMTVDAPLVDNMVRCIFFDNEQTLQVIKVSKDVLAPADLEDNEEDDEEESEDDEEEPEEVRFV
jgi:uncharacterized protein YodC (DUF2158 family)